MTTSSHADLAFVGGRVATIDAARRIVPAVAVRDGAIVAVGDDDDVRGFVGSGTRVVDLRGRSLVPGFIDAHAHPVQTGLARLACDLSGPVDAERYVATIAAYARADPTAAWIRGDGWRLTAFPGGLPHRTTLDRAVADRPALFWGSDGHTAWANSAALRIAGIDAATPDPDGGRIERDPDGSPSGALHERAGDLVEALLPPWTDAELLAGTRTAQAELHRLGITAWLDATVDEDREDRAYPPLARAGELTARVVGALRWDLQRGLEQIEGLEARRADTAVGRYAATSVKFFVDGVLENFTGALLEPYLDADGRPTGGHGDLRIDPSDLARAVTALDARGFQSHFHVIGDRAVRDMLDAVAAARATNGPSDTRPTASHLQLVHPDDIGRFAPLGVIAAAQALWACHEPQMDELTIPFLGDRWRWQYPFGSLVRAGVTLAMGSDWSVSSADPLLQMEVAVERVDPEHRGERPPFVPDERIGLMDALAGFTDGSARALHLDGLVGSIEPGKRADLALLDRDLFDRGAGPIGDARVVGTWVDGVAVHETPGMDG